MDYVRERKKGKGIYYKYISLIFLCVFIFILMSQFVFGESSHELSREHLDFAKVEFGDVSLKVQGYGKLKSDKQTYVTSINDATVKEINLKPGAVVSKGDIILSLDNPKLDEELEAAMNKVRVARADLSILKLENEKNHINEQIELGDLESSYELEQFRLRAKSKLIDKATVSKISYEENKRLVADLERQIDSKKKIIGKLKRIQEQAENIKREYLNIEINKLNAVKSRIDNLTIRSPIDGLVQRMAVELGQSVKSGEKLVMVGTEKDLMALIKVPQSSANLIEIGQKADVKILALVRQGIVTRIDPEVIDGTVSVEINLTESLPDNARPELSVDANIYAAKKENIYYIKLPFDVSEFSSYELYKLNKENNELEKVLVEFGGYIDNSIEIVSGVEVGDSFVISDMSNYKSFKDIKLL